MDPLVSVQTIADRVGLSEAGTRARLRSLENRGLLRNTEVQLNPALFGATVIKTNVSIHDPRDSEALFRDLSVLDGVLFARDIMDESERKVGVFLACDSTAATARRMALLQRLAPMGKLGDSTPYWLPPCGYRLTPLDWRLLSGFRHHPDATLARVATEARVSLKTAGRRCKSLLESHAIWWSHGADTEEWGLALVKVVLRRGLEAAEVRPEIAGHFDYWLPVAPGGLGSHPDEEQATVAGLVPSERPAALEHALRATLSINGVAAIHRTFGLGSRSYSHWADEQLASRLHNSR